MDVQLHQDYADFWRLAGPHALAREAEACLFIGVAGMIAKLPRDAWSGDDRPLLATVHDGRDVVGAAVRSPGRGLILTRQSDAGLAPLAEAVLPRLPALPSAVGPEPTVSRFADAWRAQAGRTSEVFMDMRLFQLDEVIPPRVASGSFRPALASDIDVATRFVSAFAVESLHETGAVDYRPHCLGAIAEGRYFVWELPGTGVVSMAATSGPTPHGIRITSVYTPPEHRGRGYAAACVAALSQAQLDAGKRFCFLFTDATNPTSNGLYKRIGYREIAIFKHLTFP